MESINSQPPLLNLSLEQYDVLTESIAKAHALSRIILSYPQNTLLEIPPSVLYNFLWALDDLVCKAYQLCCSAG